MATKKTPAAKTETSDTNFPISKILVPDNIRDAGWDTRVDELAASIQQTGLISPVMLIPLSKPTEDGKTHELVYGFRRLAAHRKLKRSTIKVVFAAKDMTQKQKDTARLVENTDREDLSPLEEAQAYKQMMDNHKLTAKQVSKMVAKTDGHVSQRLALLRLPEKVQAAVESGDITATHARQIHRLKDASEQEKIVDRAASMTAKAFEELVDRKVNPEKAAAKSAKSGESDEEAPASNKVSKALERYQDRKTAMGALKKLDTAKAKAKAAGEKEKTAHLNGIIRGISWTLKVKNAKLPV